MGRLQITRASHALKWVSFLCADSNFISSSSNFYVIGSYLTLHKTRFYGTRSCADLISGLGFAGKGKRALAMREQAESALAEYFHFTRNLQFMDAEYMSKNAPEFLYSLMKRVDIDDDSIIHDDTINRAVTRYLRYHSVNEYEPFFESIGLKHSEYAQFLPKGLMFLADDELLLENYYVLCDYGIERNRIGKIFKEATEVFRYDHGALRAKLKSLENLGLKQSLVAKVVPSSPHLLNGSVGEFVDFFEKLKKLGIEPDWILEQHIPREGSYNWKSMLQLMCFLCKSGWSEKQVGDLFKQHPHLLLDCSGRVSFCLIGILLKFGSTMSDVQSLLLQFPQHIPVSKFSYNLHNSYNFLHEIGMPALDIGQISRSYPVLLGSLELKKVIRVLQALKIWWCGKKRLCQMVKDDPFILEGWVRGRKLEPLNTPKRGVVVRAMKTQFLISLGFEESSKEMERTLRTLLGKAEDFPQRFDFLVKNGLSREDVIKMVKVCPLILCMTSDVIEAKIRFLIDDLGYGVSDLVAHPRIFCHGIKKLRLRLLMYKRLKDQGAVRPGLSLDYIMSASEKKFIRTCKMVKDDPFILEGRVRGRKLEPLDIPKRGVVVRAMKTQFLISLGFEESSKEMERALKTIRGKGQDLQQRFDCLVKNGLSREEVIKMVNVCPQFLNLTTDVMEAKIRFFFDDLGYGVSDLLAHPKILCYTIKRLKLRVLMYEQHVQMCPLALSCAIQTKNS